MNVRISTTATWPDPSKVFGLNIAGHEIPLLLIAIMTMVFDHEQRHHGLGRELWLPARTAQKPRP